MSAIVSLQLDKDPTAVEKLVALKVPLFQHQIDGVNWMLQRESRADFGILADMMGLGKTMQILAFLLLQRYKPIRYRNKTLIVLPTNLVDQWLGEITERVHNGFFKVCVLSSGEDVKAFMDAEFVYYDAVITTYSCLASLYSSNPQHPFLAECQWYRIILDEAQLIHNPNTLMFKAILLISLKSEKRWCVTGTPIQNNLKDLWALFAFLNVKPYSNWTHYKKMVMDKMKHGEEDAVHKRINAIFSVICLRRNRDDVITLPHKAVHVEYIELSLPERMLYDKVRDNGLKYLVEDDENGTDSEAKSSHLLTLILRLRQLVIHPGLLLKQKSLNPSKSLDSPLKNATVTAFDSSVKRKRVKRLQQYKRCRNLICADEDETWYFDCRCGINGYNYDDGELMISCDKCAVWVHHACVGSENDDYTCDGCKTRQFENTPTASPLKTKLGPTTDQQSSKIAKAVLICKDATSKGDKVVIFSQFTSLLTLIQKQFKQFGLSIYNGNLNDDEKRLQLLKFNRDPDVKILLISLKCGAVGLNLTAANHIILLDSWWNPSVEAQAMDRIYRIGQTKPVHIWKLIVKDSIEEKIVDYQVAKEKLCEMMNDPTRSLSSVEMKQLIL